ncbi:MAG: hypothetical protein PHU45_05085, partial [Bacilli bacterium]|nr:hypothetical protein [Bacilli bacterium]
LLNKRMSSLTSEEHQLIAENNVEIKIWMNLIQNNVAPLKKIIDNLPDEQYSGHKKMFESLLNFKLDKNIVYIGEDKKI